MDNEHVRDANTCPLCLGIKAKGLLLCWPCHNLQKKTFHGQYSVETEELIASFDAMLAEDTGTVRYPNMGEQP